MPVQRLREHFGYDDGDAGFTMIEAVVSFVIFAIVIAAAVLAIVAGIKTSNGNRDRVVAANVAQQALTNAQVMSIGTLTSLQPVTTTSTVGSELYTVVRTTTVNSDSGSVGNPAACPASITVGQAYWVHIVVTVTWPGSSMNGISMDSVRSC